MNYTIDDILGNEIDGGGGIIYKIIAYNEMNKASPYLISICGGDHFSTSVDMLATLNSIGGRWKLIKKESTINNNYSIF